MDFWEKSRPGEDGGWEELESTIRAGVLRVGGAFMEKLLNADEGGYEGASLPCECGGLQRFQGIRVKEVRTILGVIHLNRSYYYDTHCHHGCFPKDARLDIEGCSYSPAMRRIMGRVGASRPFAQGAEDLFELSGLEVSAKEIERVAEQLGRHVELFSEEEIAPQEVPRDKKLYICMDGTGVPMISREVEGRPGKQDGGEASTREAKLGCVFTQTKVDEEGYAQRDAFSTTYVGAIETVGMFAERLEREAIRRGVDQADHVIVIGDGAPWIWNLAQDRYPQAIQIVDLYHAQEHCWNVARLFYEAKPTRMIQWAEARCAELERGDVKAVIRAINRLIPKTSDQRELQNREAAFFFKNKERMRYDQFLAKGLFVGSGVLEAGCRTIVSQRLKLSGMHWSVRGANAIIALRCCLLSHRWPDFWQWRSAA